MPLPLSAEGTGAPPQGFIKAGVLIARWSLICPRYTQTLQQKAEPSAWLWVGLGSIPVVLILGIAALLWWGMWWGPKVALERMEHNERAASDTLGLIAGAQAKFRANDRDGNLVPDYWTGDVAGLNSLSTGAGPIQLIERSVAEADANPLQPLVPAPIPKDGYYFQAMEHDDSGDKRVSYRQNTDGSGKRIHNTSAFGVCAYPANYGVTGRFTFIVNERNVILKGDTYGVPVLIWPRDGQVRGSASD